MIENREERKKGKKGGREGERKRERKKGKKKKKNSRVMMWWTSKVGTGGRLGVGDANQSITSVKKTNPPSDFHM